MKTSVPALSSIGFLNHAQRCVYAAFVLKAASISSPAVPISPASPAVAAKPAVIAQTAKPARPASAPVTAIENTIGYEFGELYLNSPAYPAGTAIPAILAKPASAAIPAADAVVAVSAKQAVIAPVVAALQQYSNAISIDKHTDYLDITAYFPIANSPMLLGSSKEQFVEITPPTLVASAYSGAKVSTEIDVFSTLNSTPATLEEYFRVWALATLQASFEAGGVTTEIYNFNGIPTRCKKFSLRVKATDYDISSNDFQLEKISYLEDPLGGGGSGGGYGST